MKLWQWHYLTWHPNVAWGTVKAVELGMDKCVSLI